MRGRVATPVANGFDMSEPIEPQSGAAVAMVAASAARPPVVARRGRRSHAARSRRRYLWHHRQVSLNVHSFVAGTSAL